MGAPNHLLQWVTPIGVDNARRRVYHGIEPYRLSPWPKQFVTPLTRLSAPKGAT